MTTDKQNEWKHIKNDVDDYSGIKVKTFHSKEIPLIWSIPETLLDQLRRDAEMNVIQTIKYYLSANQSNEQKLFLLNELVRAKTLGENVK